jgi:hypothetical protein
MNKSNTLDKKIIKVIEEKKLTPRPRWQFLFKNYLIWSGGVLSLLFGSLAFAMILFMLLNNDWRMYEHISGSLLKFIILTAPYFWLLFLFVFITVTYFNLKHTKKGYRYPLLSIIIGSFALSMLLGCGLYATGLGQEIDDILGKRAPFYERFINRRMGMWANPDRGLLTGVIIDKISDNEYKLLDMERKEWLILMDKTTFVPEMILATGTPVRLTGKRLEENSFEVMRIMPMGPGREFFRRSPFLGPWENSRHLPEKPEIFMPLPRPILNEEK